MSDAALFSIIVNGVIFKNDKVLITQRSWEEDHEPGKWTIPGGKAEKAEGVIFDFLQDNLKREIKEEVGILVKDEMSFVTNNSFLRSSDNKDVVVIVFKCEYLSGKEQSLEDTIQCKWATLEEVKEMTFSPSVKEYILQAFKK